MNRTAVVDGKLLAGGAYARKQILCKDPVIAWSHSSRFRMACRLVKPFRERALLDYGCGDGTFLALVHDWFPRAIGADIDPQQNADCARRFAAFPGLAFVATRDLAGATHSGAYGLVVCMEVLEHCVHEDLEKVLWDLRRLVAADGTVLISVPVEIGPTLIFKQVYRRLAGWRGLGDYKYNERYGWRDLWTMCFAGEQTAVRRPVFRADFSPDQAHFFHGHKGFNWRSLSARIQESFIVRETLFSPLGWLRGLLNGQVWFICELR